MCFLLTVFLLFYGCTEEKQIDESEVGMAILRGIEFLESNQNRNGSISLNNDKTFNIWETANSVIAINAGDSNNSVTVVKAVDYLLGNSEGDGSFYYSSLNKRNSYCIETTPAAMMVLSDQEEAVKKGLDFIVSKQEADGSWDIGEWHIEKSKRHFPSATCYALVSLMCNSRKNETTSKGIRYVLGSQQSDGSWGSAWEYYDTPYYATQVCILALKLNSPEDPSIKRAIWFIERNQSADGSWGLDYRNRPSKALRTALALNSLLVAGKKANPNSIERGMKWLLKNQNKDGSWHGGRFVNLRHKREDIFATTMAVLALKRYQYYKRGEDLLCPN